MSENNPTYRFSRLPIWAIVGWLLIQSVTVIIWGAKMDERMSSVERDQRSAAQDHTIIARMDERTADLSVTLNRIDQRLTRQEDRR